MKIYVGNMSFDVAETDLEQAFAEFGEVASVNILKDRDTGQSKGFGFVEMPDEEQAQAAIAEMNDKEFMGRNLKVDKAKERPSRPQGRGGFGPRGAGRPGSRGRGGARGGDRRTKGRGEKRPRY